MIQFVEKFVTFTADGDANELKRLKNHLRYRPTGHWRSDKFQLFKLTEGRQGWDGYLYPLRWNFVAKNYTGFRGFLESSVDFCDKDGIRSSVESLPRPFSDLTAADIPDNLLQAEFDLDPDQRRCIVSWLKHNIGINHACTNSGKSAMIAGCMAMLKQRFPVMRICYITQAERLINQARRDIGGFLPQFKITQFGAGKSDMSGEIVICGAAMLWRHHPELAKSKFFKEFGALFCDELHHVASESLSKLTSWFHCPFRFGCSDTQKLHDPAKAATIKGLFGPIRDKIEDAGLIASGRSAKPIIYVVDERSWSGIFDDIKMVAMPESPAKVLVGNSWKDATYVGPVYMLGPDGKPVFEKRKVLETETDRHTGKVSGSMVAQKVPKTVIGLHCVEIDGKETHVNAENCLLHRMHDCAVVQFKERNDRIVEWVYHFSQEKKKRTLVVCTRTPHVLLLQAWLQQQIPAQLVKVLFSKHTVSQRDECFEWFKGTPGAVLVSPLIAEGVSINEIEAGVIADSVKDHERGKQILGRFIRKKAEDNTAHIVMFIENQHSSLKKSSTALVRKLAQIEGFVFKPQNHPLRAP